MKVLFLLTLFSFSVCGFSHEIQTIRDIPWKFEGVSGDVFKEQSVRLEILELLNTEVIPGHFGTRINNSIKGYLLIDGRKKIEINRFDFETHQQVKNVYSVYLKINNKFEKTLFFTLRYDLIENTFKLKELPSRRSPARFFLEGNRS